MGVNVHSPGGKKTIGGSSGSAWAPRAAAVVLCVACGWLVPAAASAAPVKVGLFDLKAAVSAAPEMAGVSAKLQQLTTQKMVELKKKKAKLASERAAVQASKGSAGEKKAQLAQLDKEAAALRKSVGAFHKKLRDEEMKMLKPIIARVEKLVEEVARAGGFALILKVKEAAVAYRDPAVKLEDITKAVIAKLKP